MKCKFQRVLQHVSSVVTLTTPHHQEPNILARRWHTFGLELKLWYLLSNNPYCASWQHTMKQSSNGENSYPFGKFCLISLVSLVWHAHRYICVFLFKWCIYTQTDMQAKGDYDGGSRLVLLWVHSKAEGQILRFSYFMVWELLKIGIILDDDLKSHRLGRCLFSYPVRLNAQRENMPNLLQCTYHVQKIALKKCVLVRYTRVLFCVSLHFSLSVSEIEGTYHS